MSREWCWVVIYLAVSRMFCNETAGQCLVEKAILGMALKGHTFQTWRIGAPHECDAKCEREVACQSYNFNRQEGICELNNRTKEARPEDFLPDAKRFYIRRLQNRVPLGSIPELPGESCHEIKASGGGVAVSGNYWLDPVRSGEAIFAHCDMKTEVADFCIKHHCQNSASCVTGHVSYTCLCRSGWTGKYCETDVDECTSGSHDCHVNAACTNSEGSYSCVCHEPYRGDGKTCFEEKPSAPPQNVREANKTSTSIVITWDEVPAADRNGVILNYTVSYQSQSEKDSGSKTVVASSRHVSLTDLKHYLIYNITVLASTVKGDGPASPVIFVTTGDMRGLNSSDILSNYGNVWYFQTLERFLDPVLEKDNRWVKCYRAETDGWNALTFHSKCDYKGPSVTIVRVGRYIFGGYTGKSWKSPTPSSASFYTFDKTAFLFSLNNTVGYPLKLEPTENNYNVVSYPNRGPTFAGDLSIIAGPTSSDRRSFTRPIEYVPPPGCSFHQDCTVFAGESPFDASDYEVFYEV